MASYLEILTNSGAATLADDAAFDLTDDAEWRFDVAASDWTPAATQYIADRWVVSGSNRNWRVQLATSANIINGLGTSTGTFRVNLDQAWTEPADGAQAQLRLTLDADNGSTITEGKLYIRTGAAITDLESDDDWTLADTGTSAGVQAWKATTNIIRLGSTSDGSIGSCFIGKIYRAIHWSDMSKTTKVFDVTFDDANRVDSTHWNDAARSGDWTIAGTENTDWRYVSSGSVAPAAIARSLTVDAATAKGAGKSTVAATARSFTVDAPVAKGSAKSQPGAIALAASILAATPDGGEGATPATVTPDAIAWAAALNQVALVGGAVVQVSPTTVAVVLPQALPKIPGAVSPAATATSVTLPVVSVQGKTLVQTGMSVSVALNSPTIKAGVVIVVGAIDLAAVASQVTIITDDEDWAEQLFIDPVW